MAKQTNPPTTGSASGDIPDTATTPPAPPVVVDEAAARAEAQRRANAEALQTLSTYFGDGRWPKLLQRAERTGMSADAISSLAGKMVATRKVHHPRNAQAALIGAANGFICALGMAPTEDDVKAFESALAATAV